ncbi:MAG: bifunctional heptose 7-phosphate kinase/heptose 1-phosphate adenyltransferase [bacterium]|nr:bifunctional heptose 7-phosphate kinase/heptose 1-phosphate adenyltransferase [bacterium]
MAEDVCRDVVSSGLASARVEKGGLSAPDLARFLTESRGKRVWVIGDVMLDEYLQGNVDRVSPEAPIPVVRVDSEYLRVGGAGNVAHGCVALGAAAQLCAVVGTDEAGERLIQALEAAGIDTAAVARVSSRPTTRKLRVLSGNQQIVRLDWEERHQVDAGCLRKALDPLVDLGPPDLILLSDYKKGVLSPALVREILDYALQNQVPLVADPRHRFSTFKGATALTPNLAELQNEHRRCFVEMTDSEPELLARDLIDGAGSPALVVTRGADGIIVVQHDGPAEVIPAVRREVCDVTGAGDTVLAVLGIALACGMRLNQAARLANFAAGVAVTKQGTSVVSSSELTAGCGLGQVAKVLTAATLPTRLASWRRNGYRIAFTNGCFDALHGGHLHLLHEAAALADVLLVGVNCDASVARLKGSGRPIMRAEERVALLAELECVDGVVVFDEDDPARLIAEVMPEVLVKGDEYAPHEVVGRRTVEAAGGRLVLVPVIPGISTSAILERVCAVDAEPDQE